MKLTLTCLLATLLTFGIQAQNIKAYTTAQAHSHNDYVRKRPFYDAYEQQFGSIEADVHLVNDTLYVAHDSKEINPNKTLAALYLTPIQEQADKNGGNIYPQKNVHLQLLIDLKTSGPETLAALVKELEPYKKVLAPSGLVTVVVSGNVPDPATFENYPDYIFFDGRPENTYTPAQLAHIGLISQAFQKYSRWNGEGPLLEKEKKNIQKMITQTHDLGKKVRIWATPDNINSWKTMMSLGVDYLNTDKVLEMGDYLRTAPR
ncbi:phosphatidylinositol-specific phospholipase C/glycerophosphodiester phosphodiesterase family protein [Dyadobacter sp. CY323]|uniref:phosphatidylinositol-specific phospholipase C/glycerophosphodiester phosphodiesterase family protein n=1 Tax=Dyadobacter sp. CY323 TaxID=2907302 RepID=UPI001F2869F6|nr:phosphatidylinositol-specific phospholipase C/glycerophosphodiester phosphodiesterase family protein [Dyadobacter sp. CY323]MCE6992693.1 phosphatidylinositol-specific phospholipase C/glycerophosphodiester phosphodiesterase family protein [Dyadobacter sp. CY323]